MMAAAQRKVKCNLKDPAMCRCVLLSTIALAVNVSFAQDKGLVLGWLHAAGNSIDHYEHSSSSADFLQPGVFFGGYYSSQDSGVFFRLEAGWEHQGWTQRFSYLVQSPQYQIAYRSGRITAMMDILRVAPQVALPVGRRSHFLLGLDLGVLLQARVSEDAEVLTYTDVPSSQPSGSSIKDSDTTYMGTTVLNAYSAAVRFGVERRIDPNWTLGAAFSFGRSIYATAGSKRHDDLVPVTVRAMVYRRIGR